MQCQGCRAEVSWRREFCPNCGTAMDSSIRESLLRGRDERPNHDRKSLRKAAVIGGGAILLALGVAGQISWPWSDSSVEMETEARAQPRGPVMIEADELHKAYRDNPDEAAELYEGREMVVSGEFLRIVPDGYGSLDLRLKTSDANVQLGIDVAQIAIEDAKQLLPGQWVTVS